MRIQYNNGDDISLQACGCNGCSPSMINGILCHETGCPDAWRDYNRECKDCGQEFMPEYAEQEFCTEDCRNIYWNYAE